MQPIRQNNSKCRKGIQLARIGDIRHNSDILDFEWKLDLGLYNWIGRARD